MIRKPLAAGVTAVVVAGVLAAAAPGASAAPDKAQRAEQAVRAAHSSVALDDKDGLSARDIITDADGSTHVRFDRPRGGLPVLGGDMVVHQTADGALEGVSATTRQPLDISLSPGVAKGEAVATARAAADNGATAVQSAVLEVDARTDAPRLVWAVVVAGAQKDQTPSELLVLVDAQRGQVVDRHEQVETATGPGTGTGFFNGSVAVGSTLLSGGTHRLQDPNRGNTFTCDMKNRQASCYYFDDADDIWGNGLLSDRQTTAVDAHYGTATTWDYYLAKHGRTGIDGKGRQSYNRVHYGRNYNNAYWSDSCFCMTYGDGDGTTYNPFDSLDVAGHEMSHGVMASTANLTYSGESGGLNEGNSDIFGTLVEFYANNPQDPGDYLIGEKLYTASPGKALRYMYDPIKDGRSPNCYTSSIGSLDVHYSSGVANHFFYLLAAGSNPVGGPVSPTCDGSTVNGLGNDAAGAIWYGAVTKYMTSSTNYAGARAATLSAAADLYGAGSAQYNAVAAAWTAVGVG
ncbi:MAG: M4 family metallopeptidase [Mycobacteriales bacterium]